MKTSSRNRFTATVSYIACIVFLNMLVVRLPLVHSFGEHFSPADILVGIIYIVRDFAQREIKHYILVAMVAGSVLSYFLATPAIALASACSFMVGEIIDWSIFTYTQKPLSKRLILSSVISSPIDSVVFLALAGRLMLLPFIIMSIGKIVGVYCLWSAWKWRQSKKSVYNN